MKHIQLPLAGLLVSLALLAGCSAPAPVTSPNGEPAASGSELPSPGQDETPSTMTCRIVDGAETGTLLLAEDGNGLYGGTGIFTLSPGETPITIDGQAAAAADLRDGMLITVSWNGAVMESWPAQLGETYSLSADSSDTDDRCGLYLQVLEDLWNQNEGLRSDIEQIGMDLSGLTDLTESEKAALIWTFGGTHGIFPLTGTWEQLVEEGYIDGESLYWEDGVFFSLTGSAEDTFDAQIWRSGLGAYFYSDCTAQLQADGSWSYEVGSEAIA